MTHVSRRGFLFSAGTASLAAFAPEGIKANVSDIFDRAVGDLGPLSPEAIARDESFWAEVRSRFDLPSDIVNLDHGYCNPLSRQSADELVKYARFVEQLPGRRLEELFAITEKNVASLARLLGVPADEIALTRNATEALDTVILGLPMKAGDEIVCSAHDYYAMLDAIEQRQKRDGVAVKMLRPPLPARSMDDIAEMYEKAIGPKTKLVLVTHASNVTGQICPVKRIAAAAHRAGAEVVVDGAQTMMLLDHKIPDLDCDYYGFSLHKWLMAPVGAGILWMRKRHVSKVWPLVPPPESAKGMFKFMWCGTYPEFITASAGPAIEFNEKLGIARKEARIRYLSDYWRSKVERFPGAKFYTPKDADASCGLGIFEIAGVDAGKLQTRLWDEHKILVQHMKGGKRDPGLNGIRVTPNVYTTLGELDKFVTTTSKLIDQGVK